MTIQLFDGLIPNFVEGFLKVLIAILNQKSWCFCYFIKKGVAFDNSG